MSDDKGDASKLSQPKNSIPLANVVDKALSPAAQEFGKEIVPLGKKAGEITNRVGVLLLKALEPLVYGLEKSGDWIEKAVSDRLKDVPKEKIEPPNPRIAVPAMQALTYSMDDKLIREMFANLLAADMNTDTKHDAHPAFVEIIKEMTPTDAKVLRIVRTSTQISFVVRIGTEVAFYTIATHYSFEIEGASLDEIGKSLNNLERLGLLERREEYPLGSIGEKIEAKLHADYESQRQMMDTPEIRATTKVSENGHVVLIIKKSGLYLNPLGEGFSRICLS
jgi:hypothetical protein